MSSHDWRWRIGEAVERIRSRYDYIGRKTGAPFLALVYPPEVEVAVLKEWQTQTAALNDPMPGSDPQMELGRLWLKAITETVRATLSAAGTGRPVASLQRLAAVYPALGPRDVMQTLWDNNQSTLDGPVVVPLSCLFPGTSLGRVRSALSVSTTNSCTEATCYSKTEFIPFRDVKRNSFRS